MISLDPRRNCALPAAALALALMAIAAPGRAAASTEHSWSGLAPVMAARIDAATGASEAAPPGDLPPAVIEAIDDAVAATIPRVSVQLCKLTAKPLDTSLGAAHLAHERSARLFRQALASSLSARGLACPDCALPPRAVRDVSLFDVLPYAIAATFIGTDDMKTPVEEGHGHLCAEGIREAMLPDDDLAEVALAAMVAGCAEDDSGLLDLIRQQVTEARRDQPKGDARAVTDLYRLRLLASRDFIDVLRGPLAAECKAAGMRFIDCPGTTHP